MIGDQKIDGRQQRTVNGDQFLVFTLLRRNKKRGYGNCTI